jgi:hypothetical protein
MILMAYNVYQTVRGSTRHEALIPEPVH